MLEFFDEFTFWTFLAFGLFFFILGFKPIFKIAVAHIPFQGLREAAAA